MNTRQRASHSAGWWVLLGRFFLLAVAIALAVMGFRMSLGSAPGSPKAAHYACPMHPEVRSDEPGECSICKMALERSGEASPHSVYACAMHPDVTSSEPSVCPICNMMRTLVAQGPHRHPAIDGAYACPMHPHETSDTPGRCSLCKMDLAPVVPKSPSAAADISHGSFACPMHPEEAAEEPGVCPICGMARKATFDSEAQVGVSSSIAGFTMAPWTSKSFPNRLAPRGDGEPKIGKPSYRTFTEDVRAAAWCIEPGELVAILYQDEVVGLQAGESATFYSSRRPKTPIAVTLEEDDPRPWDGATYTLAFRVDPSPNEHPQRSDQSLDEVHPGDIGWLELPRRKRVLLSLPEEAVLHSPREPYVLLAKPDGGFYRRRVQLGRFLDGYVVVLSGVTQDDAVVTWNAFFADVDQQGRPTVGSDDLRDVPSLRRRR